MESTTPGLGRCPHCGTAVEGADDEFCCLGCERASQIIRGAGLGRYYEVRESYAPRPAGVAGGWDAVVTSDVPDGTVEVRLAVDGLRCASCVWVTEKVLQTAPGVHEASVSYATGRTHLRWDPGATSLGSLASLIAALGYRPRLLGEDAQPDRGVTLRLGVAVFAAMNVMLMAVAIYAGWFTGMEPRFLRLFEWASLLLATPVALWCAEPFYRGALQGLAHRTLHMDVPISLAILALYGHGLVATAIGHPSYLDSLTMLVALLLAGRVLESRGRRRAAEAATTLAASVPATARRVDDSGIRSVPAESLRPGDLIEVGMGEEIAADGHVREGAGSVIMSVVTGESAPVGVAPGDRVVAGAVLESGALTIEVEATGSNTVVGAMARAVAAAADRGGRETATDRLAPWFTGVTLVVAAGTFGFWLAAAGADTALSRAVAVLVVACPCALALSRPLAGVAGLGAAARRGALLRSVDTLFDLATVDQVALDKTGTVTAGELSVSRADHATLRVAAALERSSIHPVARAILEAAVERGIPIPRADDIVETVGLGVSGVLDGVAWRLEHDGPGRVRLFRSDGSSDPAEGAIELGDRGRSDSHHAIQALEELGFSIALLTGDHEDVAETVAHESGIGSVYAEMSPEAKAEWISRAHDQGGRVLFVGDGLNDGPALAAADVGLSMKSGAASSLLIADGVIVDGSLRSVSAAIQAARTAVRAIRANQIRSIAYNVLAVAAAAYGWINPLSAAVLMPLSSLWVVASSFRVERCVARSLRSTPVSSVALPASGSSHHSTARV